jgi:hypothetical protein
MKAVRSLAASAAYVAVFAVAMGIFSNAFDCEFVYDDPGAILNNVDVVKPVDWSRLMKNDFWGRDLKEPVSHRSFRPLAVLSFRANFATTGEECRPFRITNIVLHAVVSVLFMHAGDYVLRNKIASFAAAIIFAVHPVHCDAIHQIVGRCELLAAIMFIFAFMCFHSALRARSLGGSIICLSLSLINASLAMLSKENGLSVTAFCFVYAFILGSENIPLPNNGTNGGKSPSNQIISSISRLLRLLQLQKKRIGVAVLMAWSTVIIGLKRYTHTGPVEVFVKDDNPAAFHPNPQARVMSYHYQYALHLGKLLWPDKLCHDWSFTVEPITSLLDTRNVYTISMWAFLLTMVFGALDRFTAQPTPTALAKSAPGSKTAGSKTAASAASSTSSTSSTSATGSGAAKEKESERDERDEMQQAKTVDVDASSALSRTRELKSTVSTRREAGAELTAWALMVVPFLPSANILVTVGFNVAERVLYISSMGFCMLMVQMLWKLAFGSGTGAGSRRKADGHTAVEFLQKGGVVAWARFTVALLCYVSCVVALAGRTWRRNPDWQSHNDLYKSAIEAAPTNPKNIYTLGVSYKETGRWQEAEPLYHRAFNLQPTVEDYAGAIGLTLAQDKQEVHTTHSPTPTPRYTHPTPLNVPLSNLSCILCSLSHAPQLTASIPWFELAIKLANERGSRVSGFPV